MNTPKGIPDHAKPVFTGKIFTIWQWEQELYNGKKTIFEKASRPNSAFVLMVMPNKKLMLIKDSQPDRKTILTVPGGKIENGEDIETAAKRELLEETGYRANNLKPWFTMEYPGRAIFSHHFFISTDVQKIQEPSLDGGEKIELIPVSFEEFISLFKNTEEEYNNTIRMKILELLVFPEKMTAFKHLLYKDE